MKCTACIFLFLFFIDKGEMAGQYSHSPQAFIDTSNYQNTRSFNRSRLNTMIGSVAVLYVGYFSYLQYVWSKDHEKVKFHFYNDLAGYNQMDKFGHIYGSYVPFPALEINTKGQVIFHPLYF